MPFRPPPSSAPGETPAADSQEESPATRALSAVHALAEPIARAHAVDLVDVAWVTEHGARTLRVTIERRRATDADIVTHGWGVTLEDCAELSRDLSAALDRDDVVPGAFSLEVSSPGLERELTSVEDLKRFAGQLAKVKLGTPAPDGQRLLRGEIVSVKGEGAPQLTMRVDGKPITVPVADVVRANLVFEMTPSAKPKPGAARAKEAPAAKRKDTAKKKARSPKGSSSSSSAPMSTRRGPSSGRGRDTTKRSLVKGSGS